MSLTTAAITAMTVSFVLGTLAAVWYAAPWLRSRPRRQALEILLWIHAFRYVALQIFSSTEHDLRISDRLRDQIVYGDLAGAGLAVLSIALLRYAPRISVPAIWLFVVVTVVDLGNAAIGGIREGAFATATDLSWMILTFYAPFLWVSTGLVAWLLTTSPDEVGR